MPSYTHVLPASKTKGGNPYERNRRGLLTARALRAGGLEQQATYWHGRTMIVQLDWDSDHERFRLAFSASGDGVLAERRVRLYTDIDVARHEFKVMARAHR